MESISKLQPLLSVIVPCYNAEKYVDHCFSSIVNQTYTNLEILIVDDGSTDNTGMICDAWQERDQRIRVIHQQNEGQSHARKTGVEKAKAEYVTFVDADDWIDADMYTDMMDALLFTDSDIAQCGVCKVYEDKHMEYCDNKHKTWSFQVVERIEGVLLILEDRKWRSWLWNKIFKRHLFDGVQFLIGNGFADDFISAFLFHKAQKSVYLHDEYYFYLQRCGSTTRAKSIETELKNQRDYSEAYYERYLFVKQHSDYYSALPQIKYMTIYIGINLLRNMIAYPEYFSRDYFFAKAKQLQSISLTDKYKLQFSIKINWYVVKTSLNCYKILKTIYMRMLHITNHLKITNRPMFRSLTEVFGWS